MTQAVCLEAMPGLARKALLEADISFPWKAGVPDLLSADK